MTMQPHQERVVTERDELWTKLDKLTLFIGGEVYGALPKDEQERLAEQLAHMTGYFNTLNARIAAFV